MAGMAANVSSFNTVWTYDIWQTYIRKNRSDHYYLRVGRVVTVVGILIGIGDGVHRQPVQQHHELHPVAVSPSSTRPSSPPSCWPLFWKRTSPKAGISGLVAGFVAAILYQYVIGPNWAYMHAGQTMSGDLNAQMVNFYGATVGLPGRHRGHGGV